MGLRVKIIGNRLQELEGVAVKIGQIATMDKLSRGESRLVVVKGYF